MSVFRDLLNRLGLPWPRQAEHLEAGELQPSSEQGYRATPESAAERIYQDMFVDFALRGAILDIRRMDRLDPRVKKIHGRTARAAVKGGLRLKTTSSNTRLLREWDSFCRRLQLHRREKLESDMRGLMMEGNLPLQWVISTEGRPQVVGAVRMPSETILPMVGPDGRFLNVREAYRQVNVLTGEVLARWALYELSLVRLTPDNYDDWGSMGRPYLDAARKPWKQLTMTEEDLVVRRRTRAPQRMHHNLPGADEPTLTEYREEIERDQEQGNWRDYYTNTKEASVNPISGDADLDQIADVAHLLDTFFAGAPAPKGLFGYAGDLSRDVLEDLKRDWYDELDGMQDVGAQGYEAGFRLHLLLQGLNPDSFDFCVQFAERHTETLNQRADRALKYQALGVPREMIWDAAGLDPAAVRKQREAEARDTDPYPDDVAGGPRGGQPRVSITPGNERKGDSGTAISNR